MSELLTFEKFKEKVAEYVRQKLSLEVHLEEVQKNNGLKLTGITIRNMKSNVAPVMYLEEYYEIYKRIGLDFTVEEIIKKYEKYCVTEVLDTDILTNWDRAKERIYARLINYEMNKELLESVPHKRFLDLAVTFYVVLSESSNGIATVQIKNEQMYYWNKQTEDLYKIAMENKKEYQITSLYKVAGEFIPLESWNETPMYVLTNREDFYGAVAMLDNDVLKKFSEEFEKNYLYILPCSVHETILIPAPVITEEMLAEFRWIVRNVNENNLPRNEFLSDNVYLYEYKTNEVRIA